MCAQGDFIMFFSKISEGFEVENNSISNIIDRSGITPEMDYLLQKDYHRLDIMANKRFYGRFLMLAVSLALVFGFDFVEVDLEPVLFEEVERELPEERVVVVFGAFSSTS